MANDSDASISSQLGLELYSNRDSMLDGFYLGQNPLCARGRSLTPSQLLAFRPTIGVHQTGLTHQGDHHHHNSSFALSLGPTLGQPGLSPGVTGVMRRTCATPHPNSVQVHRIVGFSSSQSRLSMFPQANEITVTEVIRTTTFLAPTSTLDRLSAPTHAVHQGPIGVDNIIFGHETQRQPNWANLPNLNPSNQVNHPSINSYQYHVARHPHHLNGSQSQTRVNSRMNMNHGYHANSDKTHIQVLNPQPAASVLVPHDTRNIPGQNQDLLRNSESDDGGESVGDGRTHSLPHPKHGPYACPKCRNVFQTSQAFAAHMLSHHYKYESLEQRKNRLAAKYRKKKKENLRLVRSRSGLTLLPQRIASKMLARQRNSTVKVKIEDHDGGDQVQEGGEGTTSVVDNNFTSDRQIKKEAM